MILTLSNGSTSNPQTIDLSSYVNVQDGAGLDFANPTFTSRVFARSLLKEGATLSLTQYQEKELLIPLLLNSATTSGLMMLIQQINMILETRGATLRWMPDGAQSATTWDAIVGQFEVAYSFRKEQQHWTAGNLRLFAQPFGRTAGPRPYAAASGVGPLLMITPYASGGAQVIGASTQAGVAGYGGQQQGASSGVFYWGSPSLAGDAPALLQVSYVGPLPNTATNGGVVPNVALSLLPDPYWQPLVTAAEMTNANPSSQAIRINDSTAVSSQYWSVPNTASNGNLGVLTFSALLGASAGIAPTNQWAGGMRLLAIARASNYPAALTIRQNSLTPYAVGATVYPGDWNLYDVGTLSLRASEPPGQAAGLKLSNFAQASSGAIDVSAVIALPDNATWFMSPGQIIASQYGWPIGQASAFPNTLPQGIYTNTVLLDDILGDQFLYAGQSQAFAPSPIGSVPSSARITPYSRGLVPRPDPKNGLPIIAIVGVAAPFAPSNSTFSSFTGASWTNSQNVRTMAQVTVLERVRYVLS